MTEYLFLVQDGDGWQVATRHGKVMTTSITDHFGGKMPLVRAGEFFLKAVQTENLEELAASFLDESGVE